MIHKINSEISLAKMAAPERAEILGYGQEGGIHIIQNLPYALKHNNYRFTKNHEKPWGHEDFGYTKADLVPVKMHLDLPQSEETVLAVQEWLRAMRKGVMPKGATQGVEIEGAVYKKGTTDLALAYADANQNMHPELMESTLETATGTLQDGRYPNTPVSVAHEISIALLEAHEQAQLEGNVVVHTSVPEGGDIFNNRNTDIPYLAAFAPRVLAETVEHGGEIPREVKEYYAKMGIPDVLGYLKSSGILNWPVNALHVHNGVPMIGEYADTRSAFAMAQIRNTEMAKIMSFMLYNTAYCYGTDMGTKDGRSILRRLLSTAHGGESPNSAEEYVHTAVKALEEGEIHSLARHPKHSQHDRTRLRMDGVTMESIDGAMNPDLRLVLGWTYINQVMNVIALDALNEVKGDESKVLGYLKNSVGPLMNGVPAMGEKSSYKHDLIFNSNGYEGKASWMTKTYADSIKDITKLFDSYAKKYPAIHTYVKIANHILSRVVQKSEGTTLEEYLGIESGTYNANGKNKGIVTDAKKGLSIQQLIDIQSKATRLQAEALSQVNDESGLLAFFGIPV